MLNLDGYLDADKVTDIMEYTRLRFSDMHAFQTPEALALYEQNYMSTEVIKDLCERAYGCPLYEPIVSYIPENIIKAFEGTESVPINYQPMKRIVTVVYLPDRMYKKISVPNVEIEYKPTTIYFYFSHYRMHYGRHSVLKDIPAKILFGFVVKEAIELGAADITISNVKNDTIVYYNVRKRKVTSNYSFSYDTMSDLIKLLTSESPMDRGSSKPKSVGVSLTEDYRGRVEINPKYRGFTITIRILPNRAFNEDISLLNFTKETEEWLVNNILDKGKGLRLIVGETMAGKNKTALSLLYRLVATNRYKVVSVEYPVEQELLGVEQINCDNEEDFVDNIRSLIRVNPDFVYVTEIQDATGLPVVQVTNTGKCMLSTLHANSVSDTLSRLMDITGLSQDRIIQTLHSITYQELVRDEVKDFLYPRNRYVRFTDSLKYQLYGKSLGEAIKIIQDHEEGDVWTFTQHIAP